jgi:uncharacterized protein YbaR (Trm112 family)
MAISENLLKILACPETKAPVSLAPHSLVESLNQRITKGDLKNHAGKVVKDTMDSGLVRSDGKRLYPIIKDIPVMLIDEGIDL